MNTRYIPTRYHLREAAESLLVAYWTQDPYHVRQARQALTEALCGGGDKEILIDIIENAIDNVHDMDVTFTDYATAVVNALLNTAIPKVENGES